MDNFILEDLKDGYGLDCSRPVPVYGGWLNRKWKVLTNRGELLVKEFSSKRFGADKLCLIEAALKRQIILNENKAPCPYILTAKGRAIRLLSGGRAYMVMEFCQGKTESPYSITINQMRSLGDACALIHREFLKLPVSLVYGYPINRRDIMDGLWANFHTRMGICQQDEDPEYKSALAAQEAILKTLSEGFFNKLPKGIGHEDFTSDNILFCEDRVSAVIDFDRNCYSYIWHDIGRALLSFALKDNKMDIRLVNAFIEGYNRHVELALCDIADALRITWCIEIPWWIRPEFFIKSRGKAIRFKDEVLWLTSNWFFLDSLLGL